MPADSAIVTSMRGLVDFMDTFLTATGSSGAAFTQDSAPTGTTSGDAAWNAASATGELYIQVAWTVQDILVMHQSLGYTGPNNPGSESGDSNHPSDVDFFNVNLVNAEVWAFANGDSVAEDLRYCHFVVEFNRDGRFVHFGFGHLDKLYGSWDGGAYKYGALWAPGTEDDPSDTAHRFLLDSKHNGSNTSSNLATMTGRNLPSQTASGDWLAFTNATTSLVSTDGNGVALDKAYGFSRTGPWPRTFLHLRGNPNNAFLPLIPIEVGYRAVALANNRHYPLGRMPDVRVCNIGNIQPRQIITIGSDDWQFFPWAQKSSASSILASKNAGVAYKVV